MKFSSFLAVLVALSLAIVFSVGAHALTVENNGTSNYTQTLRGGHSIANAATTQQTAQSFNISGSGTYIITNISTRMSRGLTQAANVTRITLYNVNGSGDAPSGSAIQTSVDVFQSTIPSSCTGARTQFNYTSPTTLNLSTKYVFVVSYDGTGAGGTTSCYNATGGYVPGNMTWHPDAQSFRYVTGGQIDDLDFLITYSLSSTNITITASDALNASSLLTFSANVTINGSTVTYSTTSGTITTNILNATGAANITVYAAQGYNQQTYLNFNTVATSILTNLTPAMKLTAKDAYNASVLTTFNSSILFNGSTSNYTTTTNQINTTIGVDGAKFNITSVANNYFVNATLNAVNTQDYNITIIPYTAIRAGSFIGGVNGILNFSVNYTTANHSGSVSTTNGVAYLPLYNQSYNITIYDVVNGSTNYGSSSVNVSASPYLHSYNFTLFLSNTINFLFIDEVNLTRISGVTISAYITGSTASYNFTTTNGTANISLIQPITYTITYGASGYNQRVFVYTLTNQSSVTLTLYMRASAVSTVVLVQVNDQDLRRVQDATVDVYTKNLTGTNEYLVEQCVTNINGQCTISADVSTSTSLSNTSYNFIVIYTNNTVGSSGYTKISNTANSACNSALPCIQLIANLAASPLSEFFAVQNLETGNVTYNGVNTFGFSFTNVAGDVQQICLYADMRTGASLTRINSSCVSASTGTLSLTANTGLGDEIIGSAYVTVGGNSIFIDDYSVPNNSAGGAGNVMFFLILGFGLLSSVFFAYKEQVTLALVMVGGVLNILFLISALPTIVKGLVIVLELFFIFLIVRLKE